MVASPRGRDHGRCVRSTIQTPIQPSASGAGRTQSTVNRADNTTMTDGRERGRITTGTGVRLPRDRRSFGRTVPTRVDSMQKKSFVLHVCVALALCAMGLAAPAAADEVPTESPAPRGALAPPPRRT